MPNLNSARPNIVLILSDDQGAWAMGCAGNEEIRTPTLDRLAQEGTRFTNFFCASPVCSPARASLLTGRIPSQHGVHDWLRPSNLPAVPGESGVPIEYLERQKGYTDFLAANGYVCGISGKWHLGNELNPQKGFTYWRVHLRGGGPYYNAPIVSESQVHNDPRYVTDVITGYALDFLEQRIQDPTPFYLSVCYTAPHAPWSREHHPVDIYDEYYQHCSFDSVPRTPMHPWQIVHPLQGNKLPQNDPEQRRRDLSGYFTAVTAMDAGISQIVNKLDQMDIRENTLLMFSSDNGMNMGHHGIYGKGNGTFPQNMFDTAVQVPAIFSFPGHIAPGAICDELLSHYDVMPTLLDYLGIENPEANSLPGRSFAPLLRGEKLEGREHVVVCDEYGPVRMIRSREWKYVHRYPYGPHEFYDLVKDPDEDHNLIDDQGYQSHIREMKAELDQWFIHYADPRLDGTREPVTGRGQLGLAGVLGNGENHFAQDWQYASHLSPSDQRSA